MNTKVAAGALIFHSEQLLIVKPPYRDYWLVPGGHLEVGESPRQACQREVKEEIGLDVKIGPLLSVDFWPVGAVGRRGSRTYESTSDQLVFLFDGSELNDNQVSDIRLQEEEIDDYRFLPPEDALDDLAVYFDGRLQASIEALKLGKTVYLEQGKTKWTSA